MTRETKIGLLVGLAFTILIGILLTEHLSSINEPQSAPMNNTGSNVRDGVAAPGVSDDGPPITIAGAPVDAPRQPVPTNVDLHPPVAYVPTGAGRKTPGRSQAFNGNPGAGVSAGPDVAVNPAPPAGDDSAGPAVARNAHDAPRQHSDDSGAIDASQSAPPVLPPASYVAVAGDSVTRIAARLMGGNTKTNRDLLIRANPQLQKSGNVVVIGRTYVIPNPSAASTVRVGLDASHVVARPAPAGSAQAAAESHPAEATRWYTVKGDDSLWRIAEAELGSGTAWTQIRDLNKDVLKGSETVHPNMRLRLPAKTAVAGAD